MQGDFDRITFNTRAHFASVLLQQGRLLLPADFNEQGAILHHFIRSFIVDFMGRNFRPAGNFAIAVPKSPAEAELKITIGAGRCYVDGIMCENRIDRTYEEQPQWPTPDNLKDFKDDHALVYLDCWERHVTWLNYARLRDPALGGPDTATRVQIAWQVRAQFTAIKDELAKVLVALETQQKNADKGAAQTAFDAPIAEVTNAIKLFDNPLDEKGAQQILDALDRARPRLAADAKRDTSNIDPCTIAPDAEYRGRENQLYRVEIHEPGLADTATFKWSRENGSVAFRVIDVGSSATETHVTLEGLGHDRRTGLSEGDWVELTDDGIELGWQARPLLQVLKVDGSRRLVTLAGSMEPAVDPGQHAILRRWDHQTDGKTRGAIPVKESKEAAGWIELERGVRIRFTPGGLYRRGDFWVAAARAATGDIEWPASANAPLAIEPHGIARHRAVLAIVNKNKGKWAL